MHPNPTPFIHEALSRAVVRTFYRVYSDLGSGFLESVYERALAIAFEQDGIAYRRQAPVSVWYRGQSIGDFRADFIVGGVIILELKAVRALDKSHGAQVLNYLRATDVEVGYLLNFGPKPAFRRLLFTNDRKRTTDCHG